MLIKMLFFEIFNFKCFKFDNKANYSKKSSNSSFFKLLLDKLISNTYNFSIPLSKKDKVYMFTSLFLSKKNEKVVNYSKLSY